MENLFHTHPQKPSEATIRLIKQIAYTYRFVKLGGRKDTFCIN